jgi:cobalt-zinc-cadmium efflux system membrane fusion protein
LEKHYIKKEFKIVKKLAASIMVPLALAVTLGGCGQEKSSKEPLSEEATRPAIVTLTQASIKEIGLQTEIISRKPFTKYSVIPAKVLANQDNEALVGSLVQGRVCKVFVRAGDNVKAGQELMLLEGLEIGQIKAGFLSARANLEYQKSNYERQKKLLEENVGAQKNLLESQNEYEKARAEYTAEKNRINAIGLTDSEVVDGKNGHSDDHGSGTLPVKSPISGIVVERNVVIGQLIEATTTAFKIINLSSVWVDGQIYEKDAGRITIMTAADFLASSYPGEPFRGKVTYIGQVIDEKTRTITIRAEFTNPAGKLKPQMFGELKIPEGNNSTALVVPAEALIKINNADYIFIQKKDSSFEKMAVVAGAGHNEQVEILKGLKDGDKIVVKGSFYLKSELLKASLGEGE